MPVRMKARGGGFLEADTEKKAPRTLTWANPLYPPIIPG